MNAYFTDSKRISRHVPKINITHGFIEFICSIVAFFTCDTVVRIIKIGVCALSFVGFFGIIGGIESGSINMISGLLIGAALSVIEFVMLGSLMSKSKGQSKNEK